jgi:hypothetical protein
MFGPVVAETHAVVVFGRGKANYDEPLQWNAGVFRRVLAVTHP